jgi:hypothetical protein
MAIAFLLEAFKAFTLSHRIRSASCIGGCQGWVALELFTALAILRMDSSDKDNDKEDSNEFHFDNFLQARSIGF